MPTAAESRSEKMRPARCCIQRARQSVFLAYITIPFMVINYCAATRGRPEPGRKRGECQRVLSRGVYGFDTVNPRKNHHQSHPASDGNASSRARYGTLSRITMKTPSRDRCSLRALQDTETLSWVFQIRSYCKRTRPHRPYYPVSLLRYRVPLFYRLCANFFSVVCWFFRSFTPINIIKKAQYTSTVSVTSPRSPAHIHKVINRLCLILVGFACWPVSIFEA
jgi:hypothetical protein